MKKFARISTTVTLIVALMTGVIPTPLLNELAHSFVSQPPLQSSFDPRSANLATAPVATMMNGLLPQPSIALAADVTLPYTENFDVLTPNSTNVPANWVQVNSDGSDTSCSSVSANCNDWIVDNNATPSSNTGPSGDHTGSGNYLYAEASGNSNSTVELQSPSFDLSGTTSPVLTFWVHRYDGNNGGDSHELHIDILDNTGTSVIQSDLLVIDNNRLDQNAWAEQSLDLSAFTGNGEVRLRFRWVNSPGANNWSPDIAIDDIRIEDTNPILPGQIQGAAFRDYNANGLQDDHEPGIAGIEILAIDENGATATTTSLADGLYTITASGLLTGNIRLEFTLPADNSLDFLNTGASGGTQVQFVNITDGAANVSVGFNDPVDYCQDNPNIAATVMFNGEHTGTPSGNVALTSFPYAASGHDFTTTNPVARTTAYQGIDLATFGELGAVYGMAWQRTTARIYVSALHKRYSDFGPNGPDAIYQLDQNGNVTGVLALDTLLGVTNSAGADVHDFTPVNGVIYDIGAGNVSYAGVGKRSFGDLEISSDMSTLYVINLFDRRIYAIDVSDGNVTNATILQSWDTPDETGAGQHRPYALAWHNDRLWVGSVNEDASAAYVHSLDPTGTTFVLELTAPLTFTREEWLAGTSPSTWNAWHDDPNTLPYSSTTNETEIAYPQPILADIEFDGDDMILGFRDRFGDQSGAASFFAPSFTETAWGDTAGDILRACSTSTGYQIETGTGGLCANPTSNEGATPSGPGGHEYYFWDMWEDGNTWTPSTATALHQETAQGGLLQIPGKPSVTTTALNPFSDFSGGILKFDNDTGRREGVTGATETYSNLVGGYTLFDAGDWTGSYPSPAGNTFAKAHGLGDIEALCNPAPLEIGNRIWRDTDGDGVQDPGEAGIGGLTVTLHDLDNGGALVGTATTDANGNYYFGGVTNANMAGTVQAMNEVATITIDRGTDDAQEPKSSGSINLNLNDIEVGDPGGATDTWLGLRFNDIAIPQGVTITNAYLQFQTDNSPANTTTSAMTIWGQAADNPTTFTSATNNISNRPRTTASVAGWSPPQWLTANERGTDQQTPDLSAIVQELVDRPGWSAGNSMVFILDGTGEREAESYNGNANGAAALVVEYSYQTTVAQPVLTNRNYEIRVDTTQSPLAGLNTSPVGGTVESNATNDQHDSDASVSGSNAIIAVITDAAGANDHSLDMGFTAVAPLLADLVIAKYDELDPMIAGTLLTYTIVITNNGPNAAENVIITDTLPISTTYQSADAACNPGVGTVTCDLGTIPLNSTVSVTIVVLVDPTITHSPAFPVYAIDPTHAPVILAQQSPVPRSTWVHHTRGSPQATQNGVEPYGPT